MANLQTRVLISFALVSTCVTNVVRGNAQSSVWMGEPSGFEVYRGNLGGSNRPITAIRFSPRQFAVSVVTPLHVLSDSSTSTSYSLEEVAIKMRPLVVVNAGATASFQIPAPVGLLIEEGHRSTALNAGRGGVFCILGDGSIRIDRVNPTTTEQSFSQCKSAVQALPMVIEDGNLSGQLEHRVGMHTNRTVAAVDDQGRVLLIVAENVDVYGLAELLLQEKSTFRIRAALNLDGSSSSGIMYKPAPSSEQFERSGYTTSLIGSAIVVRRGSAEPQRNTSRKRHKHS